VKQPNKISKLGPSAVNWDNQKRQLKTMANKCEQLSRKLTRLKYPACACGCGRRTTDWCHAITRHVEYLKYHPNNTFGMFHECHLAIDHAPNKHALMDALMARLIGYDVWKDLKLSASVPYTPTLTFYSGMIEILQKAINEAKDVSL
jgi:hypothetical protein